MLTDLFLLKRDFIFQYNIFHSTRQKIKVTPNSKKPSSVIWYSLQMQCKTAKTEISGSIILQIFIYLFVCQVCFIKKLARGCVHLRHVLQQIVLLHSCAWKSFIIHCSSLYTVTRRCDGRLVQFHLGLQGGVRNACSWTQDTGRSVWFNVCSPACDVRARTQTCSVQNPCFSPCAWISPHSMEMHFFAPHRFCTSNAAAPTSSSNVCACMNACGLCEIISVSHPLCSLLKCWNIPPCTIAALWFHPISQELNLWTIKVLQVTTS